MSRRPREWSSQESGRGEGVSDAIHQLREFLKRFDNRLSLQNLALSKRYLSGELALHVHYRPSVGLKSDGERKFCALFQEQEAGSDCANKLQAGFQLEANVGRGLHDDLLITRRGEDGHLMLVSDVDTMESSQ